MFLSASALGQTSGSQASLKMSLDVQGADVHTVLRAIAEHAEVSIVADNNVKGRVTIRALELPWRELLDTVCRAAALVAVGEGRVLRVATRKTAQEEALASESAARKAEEYMPLATRIIPIIYANAAELVEVLEPSCTSRGRVQAESRTNSLLLTDIEPRLEVLEQMVRDLDSETAQVEITAEIADVDILEARQLGVSWTGTNLHSAGADLSAVGWLNPSDILNPTGDLRIGVIRSFGELRLKLQALEMDNKANIISTPRITTVNNRLASILVGKEVPLITLDEAGNAITELKKVGISLKVTPYINSDDCVTLDLHPEVSDLSSQATVAGGVVFTTTEASTRVMVGAGETVVIAGLIRTSEIEFERGVPLLKDLPLIGAAFSSTDYRSEKRELLIFVTPRIVPSVR